MAAAWRRMALRHSASGSASTAVDVIQRDKFDRRADLARLPTGPLGDPVTKKKLLSPRTTTQSLFHTQVSATMLPGSTPTTCIYTILFVNPTVSRMA
jgi:hypothetical protein